MTITLSDQQQEAIDRITDWYLHSMNQTFFLSGFAGTGKTTIIKPLLEQLGVWRDCTELVCYTGKAALVLTSKMNGYLKAKTIHKLIYYPQTDVFGNIVFEKKPFHKLDGIDLIIVDEASMINIEIYNDLLSFNKKVLFIGDIGQLPPIESKTNRYAKHRSVLFDKPDFLLSEIHRQACDNPIIELSYRARNKISIPFGSYGKNGEVQVIPKAEWYNKPDYRKACYRYANQIICGYNTTRNAINRETRLMRGFKSALPVKGDKIICVKNNWNIEIGKNPLVNGMTGYVKAVMREKKYTQSILFEPEPFENEPTPFVTLDLVKSTFIPGLNPPNASRRGVKHAFFDYGYAITCHKSQGSQWKDVLVINEQLNPKTHHKWLYTAITRASERLILLT